MLCENSDVQLACRTSISISSMWESIVLTTSFGRRQLRKQFCASFAQARFHTAWTLLGLWPDQHLGPVYLLFPTRRPVQGCYVSGIILMGAHEAAQIHHASRQRGSGRRMARLRARAAAGDASDRISEQLHDQSALCRRVSSGPG